MHLKCSVRYNNSSFLLSSCYEASEGRVSSDREGTCKADSSFQSPPPSMFGTTSGCCAGGSGAHRGSLPSPEGIPCCNQTQVGEEASQIHPKGVLWGMPPTPNQKSSLKPGLGNVHKVHSARMGCHCFRDNLQEANQH